MEFTLKRNAQVVAILLLVAVVTQAVYTYMYINMSEVSRLFLWQIEAVIFVLVTAFAGAGLAQTKAHHLAWSAIAFAGALNVVQVGIGLTQFGPFFEAAGAVEGAMPAAMSVVAYSFMVYNAAKMLLALALIVLGMAKLGAGSKLLGGLSAAVGAVAFITNALSMSLGRDFSGELPLAGGSGVLATVLLAVCLLGLGDED